MIYAATFFCMGLPIAVRREGEEEAIGQVRQWEDEGKGPCFAASLDDSDSIVILYTSKGLTVTHEKGLFFFSQEESEE